MVVNDSELPVESGWAIARTAAGVFLMVTRSRYAAAPGLGVAWLAYATMGGFAEPLPMAG